MDAVMARRRGEVPETTPEEEVARAERKARHEKSQRVAAKRRAAAAETAGPVPERSDVTVDNPIPVPPFWGTRVVKGISLAEYSGMVDERALFLGQWGLRGAKGGSGPSYEELVGTEGRPRLRYWLDRLSTEGVLAHAAVVYGYFPAVSEGDALVVLDEARPDAAERYRLEFPRQRRDRHLCLADFWRPRSLALEPRRGRRAAAAPGHDGPAHRRLRGRAVRQGRLPRLPRGARPGRAAHRGPRRAVAPPHPRGAGVPHRWQRLRRGPRRRPRVLRPGLPRRPVLARLRAPAPNLEDRTKLVDLLQPGRIGVELSEELQLHPEQSTDALVAHHPEAKYFNAG
jgi:5-methyltetrahydrofolate--homocysteine methyltransferase